MRHSLICFLLITCCFVAKGQQADTTKRDTLPKEKVLTDSVSTVAVSPDSVLVAAQDTAKKETRKERKAREKAEKEREKYYYKDILKDSARLEVEWLSRVAWKRSMMVPGWGQYTNKGLWWIKVPVIYGGFTTAYLVFDYWQWYYKKFLDELAYRIPSQDADRVDPDLQNWTMDGLIRQKDYARRNRDMTILVTVGWWGLNVVEAYVDSMLKHRWNIGADMSMKITPTLMPSYGSSSFASNSFLRGYGVTPGIKLTMNLH